MGEAWLYEPGRTARCVYHHRVMDGSTGDELARRAGVTVDRIDRLVELGLLSPGAG